MTVTVTVTVTVTIGFEILVIRWSEVGKGDGHGPKFYTRPSVGKTTDTMTKDTGVDAPSIRMCGSWLG